MPEPKERAKLTLVGKGGFTFDVHFNPESLQYTITNTLKEGESNQTKQHVAQSTGKLSMDLIFDTTTTGKDVRVETNKVAKLMEPKPEGGKKKFPPVAKFEWGAYKFQGMVEQYQETIDFFSSTGVPLRATVKLTLAQQDLVFQAKTAKPDKVGGALQLAEIASGGAGGSPKRDVTAAATRAGDPRAARAIAAANNLESLRFVTGASLSIDATVQARASVGLTAGAGAGGSASAAFGGRAAAGVSASGGAFAGLRARAMGRAAAASTLDVSDLIPRADTASLGGDLGGQFHLGGKAAVDGSASLRADVGARASLSSRIRFDRE